MADCWQDLQEGVEETNDDWWKTDDEQQTSNNVTAVDSSEEEKFYDARSNTPTPEHVKSVKASASDTYSEKKDETEVKHQSISLPIEQPEKMKFLRMLIARRQVDLACVVDTSDSRICVLTGDEKCLKPCKGKVLEKLVSLECRKVDFSANIMKLLSSSVGEKWLEDQLAEHKLWAVVHISNSVINIASDDGDSLAEMRKLLQTLLITNEVPFAQDNEKYLISEKWREEIKAFESSPMLMVSTDFNQKKIIVEGCSKRVEKVIVEVNKLLEVNNHQTHQITLSKGGYQVLEYMREKLETRLRQSFHTQQSVRVIFDSGSHCIELIGLADEVRAVQQCIQSQFVDAICTDKLELLLIGLTLDDFKENGTHHVCLKGLEITHKCSIAVSDRNTGAAKRPSSKPVTSSKRISVASGSLTSFKADVLVNSLTCKTADWSKAGAVANAFLKDAGDDLKQELEKSWPQHFGKDLTSTAAFGKISSKRIYHILIGAHKNRKSIQLLEDQIKVCLKKSIQDNMTSIAFSALGCGTLRYDPRDVAQCFLNAQRECGQQLEITIVVFDTATREAMEAAFKIQPHSNGDADRWQRNASDVEPERRAAVTSPHSEFETVHGDLADVQADVVVNLITVKERNLQKSGVVARSLLKAAGPQLQADFASLPLPVNFGVDVAVTDAIGSLKAKKVFHAAVRKHRDSRSDELLYKTIHKCLKMANDDPDVNSIAFPTVGCGQLNYKPSVVIDCFVRAKKDTGASVKMIVVAYEDHLFKTFSGIEPSSPPGLGEKPSDTPREGGDFGGDVTFVFDVSAIDQQTLDIVKKELRRQLEQLVDTDEIVNDIVATMGTDYVEMIMKLETSEVKIHIDKTSKRVNFKGKKSSISKVKKDVSTLIGKYEALEKSVTHIRAKNDPTEMLRLIGSMPEVQYPKYWSCLKDADLNTRITAKRVELNKSSKLYREVEKLIMDTWESTKVGHGNDAANLKHQNVAVRKVWCVEHPSLYRQYETKRKAFCLQASENPKVFPTVEGLQGEREVVTRKLGLETLDESVYAEINECFLLHGTKSDLVGKIVSDGLDFRVTEKGLFGKGIYLAERSTKSDQYADPMSARVGVKQPLFMFVVRTLLGSAHVCGHPKEFRKPPCAVPGCNGETCINATHPQFNSVIGPFKSVTPTSSVRLIFREFIIYDLQQVYPEFIVEYERL